MVLSVMPIGEYDKGSFADAGAREAYDVCKGARRPNSVLMAAANPLYLEHLPYMREGQLTVW